jgi:hypothetical protein
MVRQAVEWEVRDVHRLLDSGLELRSDVVAALVRVREERHAHGAQALHARGVDVLDRRHVAQRAPLRIVARRGRVLDALAHRDGHQAAVEAEAHQAGERALRQHALLDQATLRRAPHGGAVEDHRRVDDAELLDHRNGRELGAPRRDHHAHSALAGRTQCRERARMDAIRLVDQCAVEVEQDRVVVARVHGPKRLGRLRARRNCAAHR